MIDGLRLEKIVIRGFRGYGKEERTIDLSSPVTLFAGGNRSGKSSTLNAIEWALFGDKVAKKEILGIEERKYWLAKNLHCDSCRVELVLRSDAGKVTVIRELATGRRKTEVFLYIDESEVRSDHQSSLHARLGMEPRDFMSSVYLHQEVIRDILVADRKVRKDAMERLLGISGLRNLLLALENVLKARYDNEIARRKENLEGRVKMRAARFEDEKWDALSMGERLGIGRGEFDHENYQKRCNAVLEKLRDLAKQAELKDILLPAPGGFESYRNFSQSVKESIERIRSENPPARSQKELHEERARLEDARSRYAASLRRLRALETRRRELEKEGDLKKLQSRLDGLVSELNGLKRAMEQRNTRINVINDTIEYLLKLEDLEAKIPCPSCEQEVIPGKVLELLRKRKEEVIDQVGELEEKRREGEKRIKDFKRVIEDLERMLKEELPSAQGKVDEAAREIGLVLEREFGGDLDPEKLAQDRLERIDVELKEIADTLGNYIRGAGEVERMLEEAGVLAKFLLAESKSQEIQSIRESPEWKTFDLACERVVAELELVEKLHDAIEEVLNEVSAEKLEQSGDLIVNYYRALLERQDFDWITIDHGSGYEVCALKGDTRERVISLFNQGDMNCVALAIFLALGEGMRRRGGPSFLILDDPSQSLDSGQKKKLAALLDKVSGKSQLVLATMDEELLQEAKRSISMRKKVYRLGDWDPVKGPSISEE